MWITRFVIEGPYRELNCSDWGNFIYNEWVPWNELSKHVVDGCIFGIPIEYQYTLHEYNVETKEYRSFSVATGSYLIDKNSACESILMACPTENRGCIDIVAWNDGQTETLISNFRLKDNEYVFAYKNGYVYTLRGLDAIECGSELDKYTENQIIMRGMMVPARTDKDGNRIELSNANANYYTAGYCIPIVLEDGSMVVHGDSTWNHILFRDNHTYSEPLFQTSDNFWGWTDINCTYKDGGFSINTEELLSDDETCFWVFSLRRYIILSFTRRIWRVYCIG